MMTMIRWPCSEAVVTAPLPPRDLQRYSGAASGTTNR